VTNNTVADPHGADGYVGYMPPLFFDMMIDGHPVTIHFIANDILMNFHFGIATEEVVESFLPGGIL
jgi:hypothetical protein